MTRVLARAGRFLGQLAQAQARDNISLHAGALAYATLLSLVPFLTVALVTVARIQPERAELVVRAIATMLPFSPARVQATLTMFAERTISLGWPAVFASIVVAVFMFYQVDEVINTIWGLPQRRPWQWRIVSFFVVLFWGPVLLTALFSALYWLSSKPWYGSVSLLARPLPALFAAAALTGLYRWVPHTRVTWRAALAGAAVATALLMALHLGFQVYVDVVSDLNVIYGSLSLLLFFLLSLYFFWFAILLGVEASWVVGHVRPTAPPTVDAVVTLLAAMQREGSLRIERVAEILGDNGEEVLAALAAKPAVISRINGGWRLAVDPESITVSQVCARLHIPVPPGTAEGFGLRTVFSLNESPAAQARDVPEVPPQADSSGDGPEPGPGSTP